MIYLLLTWLAAPWLWWRSALRKQSATGRVLVIQTAKIGDFVATTPVFRALRQHLPGIEIVALLHPINVPLAEGMECIDRIIVLPANGFKAWQGKRWLLRQLAEGYQGVLVLSPNLTTLLAPFWAGVPKRVSVLPDRRQGSARLAWPFLTHGQPHITGRLFRESALHSLSGLGIQVDDALLGLPPEINLGSERATRFQELAGDRMTALVGIGLGAGNRMKALDCNQLLDLAQKILASTPASLVLVGTVADQTAAGKMIKALPAERVIDTTGQYSLTELPSLLAALDCFVGVDSGATYMADALGVPVVDYMGPADAADQRPIGPRAVIISSTEPCSPCSHAFDAPYNCRLGTRVCVRNAPLSNMAAAVAQLLLERRLTSCTAKPVGI